MVRLASVPATLRARISRIFGGTDRILYEAERHEPLTASAWNEKAAQACIDEILGDTIDKFSARNLWPSHPLHSFSPDARWNLYIGEPARSGRCAI